MNPEPRAIATGMKEGHWLSSYDALDIPAEIELPPYRSVTAMMEATMQRYAEKTAFRALGETLDYAELDRLSRAFAAWLQYQGIGRGDRVGVMLPNILAFPVVMLGILRSGAVQVNLNPLGAPKEVAQQLDDAGCDVVVFFHGATAAMAEVIEASRPRHVVTVDRALQAAEAKTATAIAPRLTDAIPLQQTLVDGLNLPYNPVPLCPEDLLFLQYTGGTTGKAKGVALTHRNLLANTAQLATFIPGMLRPGQEVLVTALPLFHIFALTVNFITYFLAGAENWLVNNPGDTDEVIATLKEARPTVFTGGNTLFGNLMTHPKVSEVDWSRLRMTAGGGAAIMPVVSARWQEITGHFIREGYGLSETSPVVAFNPASVSDFTNTVGLPVPSCDVKLLDSLDNEVAIGEVGEICVKGPQVMAGYWNDPEANAVAFTGDGYLRTGDIGKFDQRGFLTIVSRKTDMIAAKGFEGNPADVEMAVCSLPGVAECACVGVPDEKAGELVKLFVVKTNGACLSVDDVIAHCRSSLPESTVPTVVRFIDSLPKSAVGKILRRELRKET